GRLLAQASRIKATAADRMKLFIVSGLIAPAKYRIPGKSQHSISWLQLTLILRLKLLESRYGYTHHVGNVGIVMYVILVITLRAVKLVEFPDFRNDRIGEQ